VFGPPTNDSGWVVGCPLDGDAVNERSVTWGSLSMSFYGEAGDRVLQSWSYSLDDHLRPAPGGPRPQDVTLTGDARFRMPIFEVAERSGTTAEFSDVFQVWFIFADGIEYASLQESVSIDNPLSNVGVPFIATCE
jgi:hypothetical protein